MPMLLPAPILPELGHSCDCGIRRSVTCFHIEGNACYLKSHKSVEYGAHRSDLTQHSWQQLSENSDIVVLYTGLYRHRADSTQLQAAQTQ